MGVAGARLARLARAGGGLLGRRHGVHLQERAHRAQEALMAQELGLHLALSKGNRYFTPCSAGPWRRVSSRARAASTVFTCASVRAAPLLTYESDAQDNQAAVACASARRHVPTHAG